VRERERERDIRKLGKERREKKREGESEKFVMRNNYGFGS
jgi:hypothetical protein